MYFTVWNMISEWVNPHMTKWLVQELESVLKYSTMSS